jgi:hypothetical protein
MLVLKAIVKGKKQRSFFLRIGHAVGRWDMPRGGLTEKRKKRGKITQ